MVVLVTITHLTLGSLEAHEALTVGPGGQTDTSGPVHTVAVGARVHAVFAVGTHVSLLAPTLVRVHPIYTLASVQACPIGRIIQCVVYVVFFGITFRVFIFISGKHQGLYTGLRSSMFYR